MKRRILLPVTALIYHPRGIFSTSKCYVSLVYSVTFKTGNVFGAGTDANVFIRMVGEHGSTEEISLNAKPGDLERGRSNTYFVTTDYVGPLKKVIVRHDNSGFAPAWFLEKISVRDGKGQQFEFPCNSWLAKSSEDDIIKLLKRGEDLQAKADEKSTESMNISSKSVDNNNIRWAGNTHIEAEISEDDLVTIDDSLADVMKRIVEKAGLEEKKSQTEENRNDDSSVLNDIPSIPPQPVSTRHAMSLSPAVRYLLDSYGINFNIIKGTGPHSRLLKGDILQYMKKEDITEKKVFAVPANKTAGAVPQETPQAPVQQTITERTSIPIEKLVPKPLSNKPLSKFEIPHLYMGTNCNIDKLNKLIMKLEKLYGNLDSCKIVYISCILTRCIKDLVNKEQAININISHKENDVILENCEENDFQNLLLQYKKNQQPSNMASSQFQLNIDLSPNEILFQSAILKPEQTLIVNYCNEKLDINQLGQLSSYCSLAVTYNGQILNEEIVAMFLEKMKEFIEHPHSIGL